MNAVITLHSPLRYGRQSGKYCYVLTKTLRGHISAPWANVPHPHEFRFQGKLLATLHKGHFELFHKYAIDGATAAPDYLEGMLQFFLHDLFYQYLKTPGCPWTRKEADSVFLMEIPPPAFEQALLFYYGTRLGGWAFTKNHPGTQLRIIADYDPDHDSHSETTYQEA